MDKQIATLEKLMAEWLADAANLRRAGVNAPWFDQGQASSLERCADNLRAAIALMRGRSWQPIETAPVGEDILVYRHGAITPYRVAMLCRGGDDEFWVDAAEKRLHVLPTRWQPLPAPPKEPADEQ